MVLFKSCRNVNQIENFLGQIYPIPCKNASKAYKHAVSSKRGYLVIDLRCKTHNNNVLVQGFSRSMHYLYQ